MGYKIVLTADRTLFTTYGEVEFTGFFACVPSRFIPDIFLHRLCPKLPSTKGRAKYAPYALRKIEAVLLHGGFTENDVATTQPDDLNQAIGSATRVVGISVVDPRGKAPVSNTLCGILGGDSHVRCWSLSVF